MNISTSEKTTDIRLKLVASAAVTAYMADIHVSTKTVKHHWISAWKFSTSPLNKKREKLSNHIFLLNPSHKNLFSNLTWFR